MVSMGRIVSPAGLRRAAASALLLFAVIVSRPSAALDAVDYETALSDGDRAWARRAEGAAADVATPGPVDSALAAWRSASLLRPEALAPRWRVMRALYYKGEYTGLDRARQQAIFDEGRKEGDAALALLRKAAAASSGKKLETASPVELVPFVRSNPDAVPCFLWAAVDWGKWSLVFGKTAAVRQGAAAKIRDYAQAVILIDPTYDEAGGYRVLGRLHHQTPSVPFMTGWASRSDALSNLRLAVRTAPRNMVNRLYLAEAIHDYEKEKRPEAVSILEALSAETPLEAAPVEDRRAQVEAAALLKAWKG